MAQSVVPTPASPALPVGAGRGAAADTGASVVDTTCSPAPKEKNQGAASPAESFSHTSSDDEEQFKEGGYGWVVVLAVHLLNAHTWGINSSFAVFLAYYLRTGSFPGASPIAYAFVGGLSVSIALFLSPLGTYLIGKYGTKKVMSLGVVIQTSAFVGASFTSEMWHLILTQGIAFGAGMGFLFVASVGIPSQWFTKRRSLANGIAAAGSGLGGVVYSIATNAMIKNLGLPWTFRILAVITFAVTGICTLVIRDRNAKVGAVHIALHWELFRRPEYCLLVSWACFSSFGYILVIFSLADYCQTVGFTATQGAIVSAMFNLSQGLGRPLVGLASDRYGRINVAALGTLVASLSSFFLWIFVGKFFPGVIVFSLFGVFTGILWATIAPLCAEVVDVALLPSALSLIWLVLVLPSTFSEPIGLSLRGPGSDGYLPAQLFNGACYFLAFVSGWTLRGWKIRENAILARSQTEATGDQATAVATLKNTESLGKYLMKGEWIFAVCRI
ncbi:hypothetical protein MAPG_08274 [Magnaporthiopsis poae ATCC 64411]|uniref:Major facilitator superfamily (MFS) profile domain-containing protein n=1 Tax=Magnaporthiopsis poae (strain ATCC 64411 / 73-15) TaxID=644358 RepID=A0A0C4E6X5_MAGP6|nr:hypothetical protein MAPG_08274 [Magnaporthiopsis poae ATCC 64411]